MAGRGVTAIQDRPQMRGVDGTSQAQPPGGPARPGGHPAVVPEWRQGELPGQIGEVVLGPSCGEAVHSEHGTAFLTAALTVFQSTPCLFHIS